MSLYVPNAERYELAGLGYGEIVRELAGLENEKLTGEDIERILKKLRDTAKVRHGTEYNKGFGHGYTDGFEDGIET